MQVEAIHTPSTPDEVAAALAGAYARVVGVQPPSRNSWLLPMAQAADETAAFGGGLWNYNLGNITTASDVSDWMYLPGNRLRFRSYNSLDEGAAALMSWLKSHGAIPAADAGDVHAYVQALQAGNYLGSDPGPYPAYEDAISGYVQRYGGVVPATRGMTPGKVLLIATLAGAGVYLVTYNPLGWGWLGPRRRPVWI